jgi:hypothetical protein
MQIQGVEAMQSEFMARAQRSIYCNVATVEPKGRPRSQVLHLI